MTKILWWPFTKVWWPSLEDSQHNWSWGVISNYCNWIQQATFIVLKKIGCLSTLQSTLLMYMEEYFLSFITLISPYIVDDINYNSQLQVCKYNFSKWPWQNSFKINENLFKLMIFPLYSWTHSIWWNPCSEFYYSSAILI